MSYTFSLQDGTSLPAWVQTDLQGSLIKIIDDGTLVSGHEISILVKATIGSPPIYDTSIIRVKIVEEKSLSISSKKITL
jgi:hypothetical protein